MRGNTFESKANTNKIPDKPNSQKDFDTYSVQSKMSYQKQPPQNSSTIGNNQKMTKSIIESLKKVYKDTDKSISLAGFKPTQKVLLSTIASFLHSFDNAFEESYLTIQLIPQLYRMMGYPSTINKTIFQPVGAPHTWTQCLTIMEWLGDLASFHVDIRAFMQEEGADSEDFTSVLIRSHLENEPNIARKYLETSIEKKSKIIQAIRFHTGTMKMEIQNIKASQKDLKQLNEEQKPLQQNYYRETQEVIQIQRQNEELQKKLTDIKIRTQQQRRINYLYEEQIASLTREVQQQELSVEEVEKIKFQIKETRERIHQLKRYEQKQKQILDKIDDNIVNDYLQFNTTLEALRHMYRMHKHEMDGRNIYLQIPECDVTKFRDFIKNRNEECSQTSLQEIIGMKQINDIKTKAQYLLDMVQQQMRNIQQSKKMLNMQTQRLNEQILQRQMQSSQQQMRINSLKSRVGMTQGQIQNIQVQMGNVGRSIKGLETNIELMQGKQDELLERMEGLIKEVGEWGELEKVLRGEVDEGREGLGMGLVEMKVEMIERVNELGECIEEFNEDMGFVRYLQGYRRRREGGNEGNDEGNEGNKGEGIEGGNNGNTETSEGLQQVRNNPNNINNQNENYMSLLGYGHYQSPKQSNVNRMIRRERGNY